MPGFHTLTRRSLLGSGAALCPTWGAAPKQRPPNLLMILTDDQGYGDLGCYGATDLRTPHADRLAREGVRFTSFYAAPVCTPSRTALLTGCYPPRVGLGHRVLFPYSNTGLHPEEETLAEVLKPRGYTTACLGKWHLGHHAQFLPGRQGFDYHFGTPYSNDMNSTQYKQPAFQAPPLPLLRNGALIEQNPDQSQLTRRYTEEAVRFLRENRARPFFLYVAHNMPHGPLAASGSFRGHSQRGLYGDAVEELDWSLGAILDELRALDLERDTLVIFTSDNGPAGQARPQSGSAGPLRGRKNSTWEGGVRVPCLARLPGRIPAGRVCNDVVSNMDILPTFARLAGARAPERRIDGVDAWDSFTGRARKRPPRDTFFYFVDNRLQAVREGRWKLHVERPDLKSPPPLLYDLEADIGEQNDVAAAHPEAVARLQRLAAAARKDLGDAATGVNGAGVRPVGQNVAPAGA